MLTFANSFDHALSQFLGMWYWIVALVIGFGVQTGLYFHTRARLKAMAASGTGAVAASGGMSAGSMVLCCLHHATDILPLIGLSAAALLLSQYQVSFIVLGILSNLVGITIMLNVMQKNGVRDFRFNVANIRNGMAVAAIVLFGAAVFINFSLPAAAPEQAVTIAGNMAKGMSLQTIYNDGGGLSIDVTPKDFAFGKNVVFDIGFNTHQGSLDFDVTDVAVLRDDIGNTYNPVNWDGPEPGGHHKSGRLTFPAVDDNARSIELLISNVYGVPERLFRWGLVA